MRKYEKPVSQRGGIVPTTVTPVTQPVKLRRPGPRRRSLAACAVALIGALSAAPAPAPAHPTPPPAASDTPGTQNPGTQNPGTQNPGTQTLGPRDGWASADGGTTGGAAAAPQHIYDVSTRADLLAAFAEAGDAPKIVRVHGLIHANSTDAGDPLTCDDLAARAGFSLADYLAAYDPAVWGTDSVPSGPLEDARRAAASQQSALITLKVPANTTIIGAAPGAGFVGATLRIDGVDNVIVRHLELSDTYDCFPQWDPTDGETGAWNSEYDSIQVINGATHVWIDHNAFTDAPMTDDTLPTYFGSTYQRHDGALDVTNGSDLVTISWNTFRDHDKTNLIGSTDSETRGDPGRLRVTFHHNLYEGIGQRAPRVRWGEVDVYNNLYRVTNEQVVAYHYSLGVGKESHLWAEANAFSLAPGIDPARILGAYGGTQVRTENNLVNGVPTDLRAVFNAANPEATFARDTTWKPTLRARVDNPRAVPALVQAFAGPRLAGTSNPGAGR
ncbi:polysaccharide lyase family 1 protein [Micrococcales bacterium 31B]|nr:polysaccharide lyase family 1 protein [Micrococcales bacterium 31B]